MPVTATQFAYSLHQVQSIDDCDRHRHLSCCKSILWQDLMLLAAGSGSDKRNFSLVGQCFLLSLERHKFDYVSRSGRLSRHHSEVKKLAQSLRSGTELPTS